LLAAAVAGTIDAAWRVVAAGRTWDYAALGMWIGVGVLSKYNACLCHAAVLTATAVVPTARRRLFDRRVVLTAAIAIAVTAPHLAWVVRHQAAIRAVLEDRAAVGSTGVGRGVVSLLRESAILAGPLLIGLGLCVWTFTCQPAEASAPAADARRWLGWYLVALTAGLLAVIAAGATRILSHWLPPLFTPLPIYLFLRFRGLAIPRRRFRRYAVLLTAAALAALVGRASLLWRGGPGGGRWHAGRDLFYETAARHWGPDDLSGATFITDDPNIGGNLRVFFPTARVVCTRYPGFDLPGDGTGPRLVVWVVTLKPIPPTLAPLLPPTVPVEVVAVPPERADRRYHTLRYAVISGHQPRQ
jgi:hypothetical protein